MIVLGLDTATRRGSVALLDTGAAARDAVVSFEGPPRQHSARLPGAILTLAADHGCTVRDIDVFAVIAGPGSFTGLRVGMATIQGLALTSGRPVVAVPTLLAMVEARRAGAAGWAPKELVVACLDGQRGEVFFAAWDVRAGKPLADASPVLEPAVGRPANLVRILDELAWRGPGVIVGDGATRYAAELRPTGLAIEEDEIPLALVAARLAAAGRVAAGAPHALRPLYIRRPDAVLARERAERVQS